MTSDRIRELEAVTFDCWCTLIVEEDWPSAHRVRVEALRATARESGTACSFEHATTTFDAAWSRHMELWREGVATGAREVATWALEALDIEHADAHAHLVSRFEEASHSGRVTALPGAADTLRRLEDRGLACGLVCDTGLTPGRVVRHHLERLGLLGGLQSLAFSDEVGVPKPAAAIFSEALRPLGVAPARAAHVGDLRANDVGGARGLGMRTVRIRAAHDDETALPDADHVVDDHLQLAHLLLPAPR